MPGKIKVRVKGIKPMKRNLRIAGQRLSIGSEKALKSEGEVLLREAIRLTPKEDGHLRDSGTVDEPEWKGGKLVVTVAFGRSGPSAAYALAHHEHPSQHSPRSWGNKTPLDYTKRGTGVKYLERPFKDRSVGLTQRIAARVKI